MKKYNLLKIKFIQRTPTNKHKHKIKYFNRYLIEGTAKYNLFNDGDL